MFHFLQLPSLALPMLQCASRLLGGCSTSVTMVRRLDRALQFVQPFRVIDFLNFPFASVFLGEAHFRFPISLDTIVPTHCFLIYLLILL